MSDKDKFDDDNEFDDIMEFRIDSNGKRVNIYDEPVDEQGNLVNAKGQRIDEDGQLIDDREPSSLIDDGNPMELAEAEAKQLNADGLDLHDKLRNGTITKVNAISTFLSKHKTLLKSRYGDGSEAYYPAFGKFIASIEQPIYNNVWLLDGSQIKYSDPDINTGFRWFENNISDIEQQLASNVNSPSYDLCLDYYIFDTLTQQKSSKKITETEMLDRAFKALGGMDLAAHEYRAWNEFIGRVKENLITPSKKAAASNHLNSMPTAQDVSLMWKIITSKDKGEVKDLVQTLLTNNVVRKEDPFGIDQQYRMILWLRKYGNDNVKQILKGAINELKGTNHVAMEAAWMRASAVINSKSAAENARRLGHAAVKGASNAKNSAAALVTKARSSSSFGKSTIKGGGEMGAYVDGNPIVERLTEELKKPLLPPDRPERGGNTKVKKNKF